MSTLMYFGYPIEEQLLAELEQLLADIQAGTRDRKSGQLSKIILTLLDEAMDVFFLEPLRLVGNDPIGEKIVLTGVRTVKKIIGVLVKTLSKCLSNEELKPLGVYFTQILYRTDEKDSASERLAFMGAPLTDDLNSNFNQVLELINAEDLTAARPLLIQLLLEVTAIAIDVFFRQPISLLNLNAMLNRAALTTITGTEIAITKVITRVMRTMDDEQFTRVAQYLAGLRRSRETLLSVN